MEDRNIKKKKVRYFRRKIINKRMLIDDCINSDLLISMKDARKITINIDYSNQDSNLILEITNKHQSIVESIF